MNIKNTMRKYLFSRFNESQIDNFYKVYYRIRYSDEMQITQTYGENNGDKKFYVIRPRKDCVEGLLSLFWNVVRNMDYAIENNYIPIVDFQNYKTQYTITNDENVWNYYFTQPSEYSLEEVYSSKNVILSGLDILWYKKNIYKANYESKCLEDMHQFIFQNIDFSDEVKKRVNQEIGRLGINMQHTIGLYLRGTDYIKLKPAGHPIQPTVEQAFDVVDDYIDKYGVHFIFLVTEDGEIYEKVQEKYGKWCKVLESDSYIYNYAGDKFLSNDKSINELSDSPYERGMHYLVKMIILSKCGYLIGGNTNGMWAANVFAQTDFKDKYIFELGTYGK